MIRHEKGERQAFVDLRLASDKSTLLDPVVRLWVGGLKLIREDDREGLELLRE
mgnify:CR=1 FL=1